MKSTRILLAIPLLASLYACQSEAPQESDSVGSVLSVRGYLPDSDITRSHITYGNTNIDKEIFRWHEISDVYDDNDFITVFNVTRLSENLGGVELNAVEVDGNTAKFESAVMIDTTFSIKAGDLIFASYYNSRTNLTDDNQYVFTMDVGTESNKPQYIVEKPEDSMEYMQGNLKMYAIETAVEDDKIPDLHFRHLSAIFRVSLRNETGHDIFPTKLEFEYPETESIFNTTLYCSVDPDASNGSGLIINTDKKFFSGSSVPYTDNFGTSVNGKDGTYDDGGSIANGTTYDLYISTVPKIANTDKGKEGLNIKLIQDHNTSTKVTYSINIPNFNVAIEAGKRYWFNLTAVEDEEGNRKLMLTNEWLAAHPGAEPNYK